MIVYDKPQPNEQAVDSGSSTTVVELQKQYKMYHGYKMSKMYGETILKDSLYLF